MGSKIDRGSLTFLLGLAATLVSGCDDNRGDWRVCTDHGRRVADSNCPSSSGGGHGGGGHAGGGSWAYINRSSTAPAIGEAAASASSAPSSGTAYSAVPATGIARGGFGGTAEGHGGGEGGEGGGHGGGGE